MEDTQKSEAELRKEKDDQIVKDRYKVINDMKISDDEKEILRLYDQGVQNFEIAKRVFKFVNADTVGTVINTVRKVHAEDYQEVETINSYKGYTGV